MKRFDCLKLLNELITDQLVVVTLGVTGDEWYALNHRDSNLYLSSMGYVTPAAMGLAMALPHRKVVVLDSDGSLLLNLGSLATLAVERPSNMAVFVFDNECYESIGGPPSATGAGVDLAAMAQGAGIKQALTVRRLDEFEAVAKKSLAAGELSLVVVKIERAIEKVTPKGLDIWENKYRFVRYIESSEKVAILSAPTQKRRDPLGFSKD